MQRQLPTVHEVYKGWLTLTRNQDNGHVVVHTTDSVSFMVYVEDWNAIILLEQSREPMKDEKNPQGLIVEVPAGRFDVDLPVAQLIAKEAKEEFGAEVDPHLDIDVLNFHAPVATSPGVLTERQYLAYVHINSSQLESEDRVFGVPGEEEIKRLRIPVKELEEFVCSDLKTFALIQWFLRKIAPNRSDR